MKIGRFDFALLKEAKTVASFGQARLLKSQDGKMELRGGTAQDRTAAKEWISMFFHEAVPRSLPLTDN